MKRTLFPEPEVPFGTLASDADDTMVEHPTVPGDALVESPEGTTKGSLEVLDGTTKDSLMEVPDTMGTMVPNEDSVEAPAGTMVPHDSVEAPAGTMVPHDSVEAPDGTMVPHDSVEAPDGATEVVAPKVSVGLEQLGAKAKSRATPKKEATAKAKSRATPKKKATPKMKSMKKATPKRKSMKKATPKKKAVKKATPEKNVVKEAARKKKAVKEATPMDGESITKKMKDDVEKKLHSATRQQKHINIYIIYIYDDDVLFFLHARIVFIFLHLHSLSKTCYSICMSLDPGVFNSLEGCQGTW